MFSYLNRGPAFYRQVLVLAAPIVLQNLITSTLAIADTFMVGFLGEQPMAAVMLANIPLFVLQLFVFGIQSGGSVLISQYWGKQDLVSINRVMGVTLWIACAVSLSIGLVLWFWPVQFLSLFGNNPATVAMAAEYGRWAGFSYLFNSFAMVYLGAFRSMEAPHLAMYVSIVSMTLNTFLNWVLIFGKLGFPSLGVEGAAIATLIARMTEVVLVLIHSRVSKRFPLRWGLLLRPGRETTLRFFRYGSPVVCNETLWGLGTAMFPTIMGHMAGSTEILAAYAIVGNVERLCQVAAFGIASTAAILIGREIGAGREHTVYDIGKTLNTLACGVGVFIGGLLFLFTKTLAPAWLFPLFHLSDRACAVAGIMLTVMAVTMPLKDLNTTNIVGVLRGGGDVRMATIIDLSPLWFAAVPLAALAGLVLKLDILWVYLCISVEQLVKCALGVRRLRSNNWVRNLTHSETVPSEP